MFIRELFQALALRGVPYAVIGGVAVNLHGVPRMTYGVCSRAVLVGSGGATVRVASVADIIAMKRLSGRTQDLADIAHLVRLSGEGPAE